MLEKIQGGGPSYYVRLVTYNLDPKYKVPLNDLNFIIFTGDNPLSLDFNPPPFQDGSRLRLPVAVMASNRPSYLLRMLLSLCTVEGLFTSLVTVFIDGFFDEPASVEQHAGAGRLNSRISQVNVSYNKTVFNFRGTASSRAQTKITKPDLTAKKA